jgi:hypothetical protein
MNMRLTYRAQLPLGEGHKGHAAGTKAVCLATKLMRQPDVTNRRVGFDFVTSIWCCAMVGFIAAALIPPFLESRTGIVSLFATIPD